MQKSESGALALAGERKISRVSLLLSFRQITYGTGPGPFKLN